MTAKILGELLTAEIAIWPVNPEHINGCHPNGACRVVDVKKSLSEILVPVMQTVLFSFGQVEKTVQP
jgi:hypothetical protein